MEQTPRGCTWKLSALSHLKESYQTEIILELSSAMPAGTSQAELWWGVTSASLAA